VTAASLASSLSTSSSWSFLSWQNGARAVSEKRNKQISLWWKGRTAIDQARKLDGPGNHLVGFGKSRYEEVRTGGRLVL